LEESLKPCGDEGFPPGKKFITGLFSWAKPHIPGKEVGATPEFRQQVIDRILKSA
jgi:hypothetical protein